MPLTFYSLIVSCLTLLATFSSTFAHETIPYQELEADMVYIEAGPFTFGTDKTDPTGRALELGVPKPLYKDEHPKQDLFLKGFYIDRYEVTNRRFQAFVDKGYFPPSHWKDKTFPEGEGDFPVVQVNWFDAANFCQFVGKELPTEKQWEKAARGRKGNEYPWGNTFSQDAANLSDKAGSKNKITAVGSFPKGASAEGVHDLVGNVWEWVQDDYTAYNGSPEKSEAFGAGYKVLRGQSVAYIGHFPGDAYQDILKEFARSGYRQYADPDQGGLDVGFRCVSLSAPEGFEKNSPLKKTGVSSGLSDGNASASANTPASSPFASSTSATTETEGDAVFNPFEPQTTLPTKSGILILIVLSFLAGLFSFLSPCTLPILPAYFAITAQADRARMTLNSFAFFCGLAFLFVLMGASASFLGGVLRDYLNELTTIGGVLVILFGIMTLAGKGFSGATFQGKPVATLGGYFLFGATFAMGWTPCVGPILSGILILAASDRTIFQGMALLFFYAVGLGVPLILIAAFCSHLSKDGWFWRMLRGKGWNLNIGGRYFLLHSTNVFTGLLLIFLGAALTQGYLTYFNNLIPIEIQIWFSGVEEAVVHWFT